jgi:predicted dehydrogenase
VLLNDAAPPLAEYWRMAASPVPIVVVGGGRWGRTWANVVAEARGTAAGLTVAARTDADSVRHWLETQHGLGEAILVSSLGEALQASTRPVAAIVASRPRDHVRDGLEALAHGLHVLVEKPISPQAEAGHRLLAAARNAGRVLAVGTEFAFLPAFHIAAAALADRHDREAVRLALYWDDPVRELRHGGLKTHHEETSVLVDLLAHAISIFRIFASGSAFHIVRASIAADGNSGHLALRDDSGGQYELHCDRASSGRRRALEIIRGSARATIDFAEHPPTITTNGHSLEVGADLAALSSTLRLELGAFLMEVTGAVASTPISAGLADLVRMQAELERALA